MYFILTMIRMQNIKPFIVSKVNENYRKITYNCICIYFYTKFFDTTYNRFELSTCGSPDRIMFNSVINT